jgi:hypothetical protein
VTPATFATQDLRPREQLQAWQDWFAPVFDISPMEQAGDGFCAKNIVWSLGDISISQVLAPSVRVKRAKPTSQRRPQIIGCPLTAGKARRMFKRPRVNSTRREAYLSCGRSAKSSKASGPASSELRSSCRAERFTTSLHCWTRRAEHRSRSRGAVAWRLRPCRGALASRFPETKSSIFALPPTRLSVCLSAREWQTKHPNFQ